MVTWPSGKAKVCKTFIHQFKSGRHLHKTVIDVVTVFFVVFPSGKSCCFKNVFDFAAIDGEAFSGDFDI